MDVEMEEAQPQALDQADPQPPDQDQPEPQAQDKPQPEPQPEDKDKDKDKDKAQNQPQPQRTPTKDQYCQTEEQQPCSPRPDKPKPSTSTGPAHNTPVSCAEPGDPPLLQQPLQTSKSGIQQIIECFRSGTTQLKHILLKEVDTIFECKLCRSLFRGLPNLITHKEYYCLTRLPEPDGPSSDDKQSVAIKDLLEAIYPRKDRPDYVVRLEPIQTSSKAVFQYTSSEEELAQLAQYPQHTPRESRNHSPEHWGSEQAHQADDHSQPGAEAETQRRSDAEDEGREEAAQPEEDGSTSGVEDVTISCCLCGKDFNSRRSIRRHCRKMHQSKLEELRKFTETRTVPISLLSMVKGRPRTISKPTGKSCPVCFKAFATKANVRRHFDEVHRGLRRDTITPDIATRPGQPLSLEATPPRKSTNSSPTRGNTPKTTPTATKAPATPQPQPQPKPPQAQYNLASCRCLLCKRKYNSQVILKRHMRIVHRIYNLKNSKSATTAVATATTETNNNNNNNNSSSSSSGSTPSNSVRVKEENVEPSDDPDSSPAPSPSNDADRKGVSVPTKGPKLKEEEAESPKMACRTSGRPPKLSVGFDFKQLFCKLCKRQFSSRQNLTKHIELHTDGNDIFIKFYRCPLCRYESRRKRDVLRHVTVVHKKSTGYLAKIMPKLESRAVKRPAEVVLNTNSTTTKRVAVKEEVNGRHSPPPPPSPPVTRKQDLLLSSSSSASSTSTPVTRKQDRMQQQQQQQQQQQDQSTSPPLTRKMDKQHQDSPASATTSNPPVTRRQEAHQDTSSGTSEVRVTKNFSLHACDVCGRAFAKKLYLDSHKRSHRNAAAAAISTPDTRTKGVSTRSKALLW